MVKGTVCNQTSKPHTGKKPVSSNSKSTGISSPADAPQAKSHKAKSSPSVPVPSCCACGVVVTDDTRALQCDRCVSAAVWKCADCLNLSRDLYDHLVTDSSSTLRWFCDGCEKSVMSTDAVPSSTQNGKLDTLITLIEKLMEKYETIDRKLENKCDVSDVATLEVRIKNLEDRFLKSDRRIN